jgi:hypothetical protein
VLPRDATIGKGSCLSEADQYVLSLRVAQRATRNPETSVRRLYPGEVVAFWVAALHFVPLAMTMTNEIVSCAFP